MKAKNNNNNNNNDKMFKIKMKKLFDLNACVSIIYKCIYTEYSSKSELYYYYYK